MSTIRPNTPCKVVKRTQRFDANGRPTHTVTRRREKCAVIWLRDEVKKTTVRSDSSATRGRAEESTADARLLFKPDVKIATGDLVEIKLRGAEMMIVEVVGLRRRIDVGGSVHHIEMEGNKWASD